MFRPLLVVLAFALLSCGGPQPVAVTTAAPRFDDTQPVDWPDRAPHHHPVHGIDLSRYQGDVDWSRARAAGVSFAFIKATEGGDRLDPAFRENWDAAGRAGVARGAYHFFYWCGPPVEQAEWFIRHVPRSSGALPPVLDLEYTPFSPTCTRRLPPAEVRARARAFIDVIARHYGQRPVIYTTTEFWRENEIDRLGEEVWLRSTARHVSDAYPDTSWTFWQYSGTGIVPGIEGEVDLNAFNGGPAEWLAWLAARGH